MSCSPKHGILHNFYFELAILMNIDCHTSLPGEELQITGQEFRLSFGVSSISDTLQLRDAQNAAGEKKWSFRKNVAHKCWG